MLRISRMRNATGVKPRKVQKKRKGSYLHEGEMQSKA